MSIRLYRLNWPTAAATAQIRVIGRQVGDTHAKHDGRWLAATAPECALVETLQP